METERSNIYATLDSVPNPQVGAEKIVAVVKKKGAVAGYQLSDGRTLTRDEGVSMARAGEIKGVGIAHRKGTAYLKALPDGTAANNLSSLPSVGLGQY